MTAFAVGAHSADPERARFIRALVASLLLHALFLVLKVGPATGVRLPSVPGGGAIEAVLRRAPAAAVAPAPAADAGLQLAQVVAMPDALKLPQPGETLTRPVAAAPAPATSAEAAGMRDEGRDAASGAAASGSDSLAIPLLPPLPSGSQHLPRPGSLLAPLNFSYPPNISLQGGRVRVRILLDEKGRIEEMRTVAAVPPGIFDHAAMQLLRSARFAPGFAGPLPARSYLYMELSFGPGPQGQQVWYTGSTLAPPAYPR